MLMLESSSLDKYKYAQVWLSLLLYFTQILCKKKRFSLHVYSFNALKSLSGYTRWSLKTISRGEEYEEEIYKQSLKYSAGHSNAFRTRFIEWLRRSIHLTSCLKRIRTKVLRSGSRKQSKPTMISSTRVKQPAVHLQCEEKIIRFYIRFKYLEPK